jgi:hypothetical protein
VFYGILCVTGEWHDYPCSTEMTYLCKKRKGNVIPLTTTATVPPKKGGCRPGFNLTFGKWCSLPHISETVKTFIFVGITFRGFQQTTFSWVLIYTRGFSFSIQLKVILYFAVDKML